MADMPIGSPLPLHHVSHLTEEWDGSGGLHMCKGVMDDGTAEGPSELELELERRLFWEQNRRKRIRMNQNLHQARANAMSDNVGFNVSSSSSNQSTNVGQLGYGFRGSASGSLTGLASARGQGFGVETNGCEEGTSKTDPNLFRV